MRKPDCCINYVKTKTQISFSVTAKLISVFVFATQIVQSLYFLNPKFQASSHLLWLYSPVCVRPGRKPRRPVFLQRGSINVRPAQLAQFIVHLGLACIWELAALRERLHTHKIFTKYQCFYLNYHKFSIKSYVIDVY